ncbi:hypothetical protein ACWEWI_34940 [Streptomyces sp. NPDC003753]
MFTCMIGGTPAQKAVHLLEASSGGDLWAPRLAAEQPESIAGRPVDGRS